MKVLLLIVIVILTALITLKVYGVEDVALENVKTLGTQIEKINATEKLEEIKSVNWEKYIK